MGVETDEQAVGTEATESVEKATSDRTAPESVSTDPVSKDEVSTDEVSTDAGATDTADDESGDEVDDLVEEGEIAGDYLEQLLDVLDYDGDIDLDVEGDRAVVSIDGGKDLSRLVGRRGEVLDALQELTRLAVQQSTGERSRLMLDVAGWRAGKRSELAELGRVSAQRVKDSGEREELEPMTPFERKIIHDAVATIDGVTSESEGVEPKRFVVILPA